MPIPRSPNRSAHPHRFDEERRRLSKSVPVYEILLIDDDPDSGVLLQAAFDLETNFFCRIRHVERVDDGVSLTTQRPIDVVLLDLGLAETRGLETVRVAQETFPEHPIIVLTGNDDSEMGVRAVQAGAEDYMVKGQESASEIARCIRYARERHRHVEAMRDVNARLEVELEDRKAELRDAQQRAARNSREK